MFQDKILHIVSNPFFVDRGGLTRIYEEVRATLLSNPNVFICSYPGGRDIDDIKVYRIPWIFWYKNKSGGPHDLHRLYLDFFLLFYSFYLCVRLKPSVIHTHGITGIISGKIYSLFNKNCILIRDAQAIYADEIFPNKKLIALKNIFIFFERWLYALPDATICSNISLAEILQERYKIKKKIVTVPDGIGQMPVVNPINKTEYGIKPNEKVIGFIGLLIKEQGIEFLFEAIKKIATVNTSTKFIIIGHPNEQKYQQIFTENGLKDRVIFLGAIDYHKIYDYISIFDIAVSPKVFKAGAGNGKLLNYLAMGIPTVVFEHPVNRYYLGESALYAEYKNSNDFSDKILLLLEDDFLYNSIKNNVKKRVHKFQWDEMVKDISEVYSAVSQPKLSINTID